MMPFRERNPVVVGAVSIAALAVLIFAALRAQDLPLIGGGTTYHAAFAEAGGLKVGDPVRIAGVRVGEVTSMELQNAHVEMSFRVKTSSPFGPQTGAAIRIETLLGQEYLALLPKGPGQLASGAEIPISRTTSPYNVVQAFSGLASRAERINTTQLASALNTLAAATKSTPAAFHGTLTGLSALSANIAARNAQLASLLQNLHTVSGTLANHSQDVVTLMRQSRVLLTALVARRAAVHRLLVSTSNLSLQLTALVRQSSADIHPALANLQQVVNLLLTNQANLDQSLRLMAPFYRVFANTLGDGPWFDTWIANLPPTPNTSIPKVGG